MAICLLFCVCYLLKPVFIISIMLLTDIGSIQFCQFQFHIKLINSNFTSNLSIPIQFYIIFTTPKRCKSFKIQVILFSDIYDNIYYIHTYIQTYNVYLLRVSTPSSLYSKYHGRNISEL